MCNLKFLFLIISIGYVAGEVKFRACEKVDLKCVTELMRQITRGFPEYDIPSLDPYHIPELKMQNEHVTIVLTKVNITGLAKQVIEELKFYPDGKSIKLSFVTPMEIVAEMTLNNLTPTQGTYNLKATVIGNSQYTYGVTRANDFEYFTINPNIVVGQAKSRPEAKLIFPRKLRGAGPNEADDLWHKYKDEINNLVVETLVVKSYEAVMNNIVLIVKKLPKSTFFTDL